MATKPVSVRDRILDAAMQVLLESGVRHLTQMQVAERAGVRQSHLTYYFSTRDALLEAVTERGVGAMCAELKRVVGTPHGRRRMLEHLADAIAGQAHMRMFVAMIVEADGDPAIRKVMRRATQTMEAALAETLGAKNAAERARMTLAALWGLGLYHFLMRPGSKADPTRAYLSWLTERSS